MFNVRLVGGHLYGKQLFTWLSLLVSLMASFVLSLFPLDVLDEIWDLIESVSEGFLTLFFTMMKSRKRITKRYDSDSFYNSILTSSFNKDRMFGSSFLAIEGSGILPL